jgi:hypothetical protein
MKVNGKNRSGLGPLERRSEYPRCRAILKE